MIKTHDLSVTIGGKTIISAINISARPGEITAIVGPNGSGKTTLLRALSGDIAFGGMATIDGLSFADMKPWVMAERRAVLPQASSLSFPFTVYEIVRLGLSGGYSGVSEAEQEGLPAKALERVDLSGFSGRLYQELSGGEQQRAQLARVLCQVWEPVVDGKPRYLLLDEPVSSLDIKHQIIVMEIAREFAARGGAVIAVLHDLNLTGIYADQVIIMHNGQLNGAGPTAAMFTNERLSYVYGCPLRVGEVPTGQQPFILPHSATR